MAENIIQRISLSDENEDEEESSEESEDDERDDLDEIPSRVRDRDYIYIPSSFENFEEREEWNSSGKWMVFSHGDIDKLDRLWKQLQPLVADGTLVCIKSSTATDPVKGVIMCYTLDCDDKGDVKRAADAIRNVADIGQVLYYKTNEASQSGKYQMHGDNNIAKYMHTVACSLYEKDKHNRWVKVEF